ncbi:MAG: hypothetical protein PHV30_10480 [Candidatus Margulisbacteria bacterium]|nr:hypothetical protein [Candidatus Margulisiibacteriota bacterium]
MNTLEILTKAINERRPVVYEYNKEGKVKGERFGDPHAVFIFTSKTTQVQTTKVHIVQRKGVSDSETESPFPAFRMFNIEDLANVKILESEERFEPFYKDKEGNRQYNPEWEGYKNVIAKV